MKRRTKYFSVVIAIVAFTAFGFSCMQNPMEVNTAEDLTVLNIQSDTGITFFNAEAKQGKFQPNVNNLWYGVVGKYTESYVENNVYYRPTTKEKLIDAKRIKDIIPYYPSNWIDKYESVEVSIDRNGKTIKEMGNDDILNQNQKALFNKIELSDEITLIVNYSSKNSVTEKYENQEIKFFIGLVPKTEAGFIGGYEKMISYLKENSGGRLYELNNAEQLPFIVVGFTVNENGETENIYMSKSSGENGIDEELMELIHKMPPWSPAKSDNGEKVKQEFKFTVGMDGC